MGKRNRSAVDAEIDRSLKQAFDTLADEPLPDALKALVDRLREAEDTDDGPAKAEVADPAEAQGAVSSKEG